MANTTWTDGKNVVRFSYLDEDTTRIDNSAGESWAVDAYEARSRCLTLIEAGWVQLA